MSVLETSRKMTSRERTAYDLGFHEGQNSVIVHGKPAPHYETFCNSEGHPVAKYRIGYECPFCGDRGIKKYCPNCGAKMDGERSEA